ncbi:MAG: C2 family cysteine protease [Myxococcota bacterium]
MPSAIGQRIATALTDRKVSAQEVTELITAAKAEKKFTPELKSEIQALLTQHADAFEPAARSALQAFVDATPVRRDLADPAVLDKHSTSVAWNPVGSGGSLYVDGISFDDVIQGSIANCYMVSAFSALAEANPDTIKNAITDNGDGTYTVRFFEKDAYGGFKPVKVTVDSDLATEFGTTNKYAKARDANEQWVTILEKAYAQWKGGYEAIGNGGRAGDVFEALTGKRASWTSTSYSTAERIYSSIATAIAAHKPVTAGTHGKDSGVDYTGTGVYAWHAYTVLGASEENGTKYIELRNPWGRSEHGNDGKDDGIFKMKLDDFMKLYNSVYLGG